MQNDGATLLSQPPQLYSRHSTIDDQRDRPATVRALVLRTAGHINLSVADKPRQGAADEGAGMAGGRNIEVVQHGMPITAQAAIVARLGLAQHRHQPPAFRWQQLAGGRKAETAERPRTGSMSIASAMTA